MFVSSSRSLFLLAVVAVAAASAYTQTANPQPAQPQTAAPQTVPPQAASSTATPKIDGISVFEQPQTQTVTQSQISTFVLKIHGTGFETIKDEDLNAVRVIVFPSTGVSGIQVLSRSADKTSILAQFSAPPNFTPQQVALSLNDSKFVTFDTGVSACNFNEKVKLAPQVVPEDEADNKYGHGVAKNFRIIQLSFVNGCPMAIVVPLGGIKVVPGYLPGDAPPAPNAQSKITKPEKKWYKRHRVGTCPPEIVNGKFINLVPFSLDHITSIYSADRKLTGRRAIYFNIVQAAATMGSAIEPFFGHGFTQGVAILGGGFTTASKEIMVDMSTEQLQNITSQSFGATEQISAKGSVQKFIFISRDDECQASELEEDLISGKFSVNWELSPASTQAPTTQTAQAVTSQAGK